MGSKQIPTDKINLRLILVSGKTKEFLFSPNDSAAGITQYVHEHWPEGSLEMRDWRSKVEEPANSSVESTSIKASNGEEWSDEQILSSHGNPVNILRLIYQGRFLHGNVTLGALQLPLGKTTVMHLVARENLPEPNNQGQLKKDKNGETQCSNCCVLL